MCRSRLMLALMSITVLVLANAPAALAHTGNDGQGWYGETTDKVITNAMFLTIAFFPTVIVILTLIQWRLEKRKHNKLLARKRRAASADWRGGW
jgi:heme/copper-type cytochrome/quinol oxidase subunit 2